ncbi:hypothetical protein FE258_07835 [Vagococcus zengguangii]|uniref:Uncharacterized protein n=1 Tax=Vagococcus zengguangii TaxID=2571750 RepID=A0A4D7CWY7_9ENTE|nr:hypothetical protein FA707_06285 [Vagococcus zengguangii]TLG79764.1 hypothetical protein FE258_07835 [Vagococcus zengguangii]
MSFICAVCVFPMSIKFQEMSYWGEGLTWFWVGVALTYITWLTGFILLIYTFVRTRTSNISVKLLVSILLLITFLWTTFVIIGGLSGF